MKLEQMFGLEWNQIGSKPTILSPYYLKVIVVSSMIIFYLFIGLMDERNNFDFCYIFVTWVIPRLTIVELVVVTFSPGQMIKTNKTTIKIFSNSSIRIYVTVCWVIGYFVHLSSIISSSDSY